MIIIALLIAANVLQPAARIVASRTSTPDMDGNVTVAELVERPRGLTDEAFAQHLIDASGLRHWDGEPMSFPAGVDHMGAKAVHASRGPEVTVYYFPSDSRIVGRVCRISRKRGGMTPAWQQAQDWCASSFGLPPRKWMPIVGTTNGPTTN